MRGSPSRLIAWLREADPSKTYEVKEVRKGRSLTQNGYYWAMLGQLAAKLQMPESEVHLGMLREWGTSQVVSVDDRVPCGDYFRYFDVVGHDPVMERNIVKVYKGSSQMDSAEFSRLINGMREECEAQGIDVATPEEIARMRFVEPDRNGI